MLYSAVPSKAAAVDVVVKAGAFRGERILLLHTRGSGTKGPLLGCVSCPLLLLPGPPSNFVQFGFGKPIHYTAAWEREGWREAPLCKTRPEKRTTKRSNKLP